MIPLFLPAVTARLDEVLGFRGGAGERLAISMETCFIPFIFFLFCDNFQNTKPQTKMNYIFKYAPQTNQSIIKVIIL